MTRLPDVLAVISRPSKIETPDEISVPSVRVKRDTANLAIRFAVRLLVQIVGLAQSAVSRFTRTLGTLISSGVSILDGLEITAKTSGNRVIQDAIME